MKKRFKIILNVEVDDPDAPYPAGGSYTHLTRLQGLMLEITSYYGRYIGARVTLDKVIDKGEVNEHTNIDRTIS